MKCLKCDGELELFEIKGWFAKGPAPKQAHKCLSCGDIYFEYTAFSGQPILVNISAKPRDILMSEWIADSLRQKKLS